MCKLLYQQHGAPAATRQGSRLLESDVPSVRGQAAKGSTMFLRLELLMYVQYTVMFCNYKRSRTCERLLTRSLIGV